MSTIKIQHNEEEIEVSLDELELPEGYSVLSPGQVPDGYYSKEAVEQTVKERLKTRDKAIKEQLESDNSFHKSILSKYNVQLDENGKPKGLKPEVDIDEVKKNVAESVKKEYEEKYTSQIEERDQRIRKFESKSFENAVRKGGAKIGMDDKYFDALIPGGKPYLKTELQDHFKYNDDIDDFAQVDSDESFVVDGNGVVTVERFFDKNKDKYAQAGMLKDNRQTGSGFQKGGSHVNGTGKKRSEISNEERSQMFQKWREEGKQPLQEWQKLPA